MQQGNNNDYKNLLTDVIKKQIVILGPDITLAKARNVQGLTITDDGTVTDLSGEPQQITQALIDQFVQLSGMIVKKTMEPLLAYRPDGLGEVTPQVIPSPSVPPLPPVEAQPQQVTPITAPSASPVTAALPPLQQEIIQQNQPVTPVTPPLPKEPLDHIDESAQKLIDDALKTI